MFKRRRLMKEFMEKRQAFWTRVFHNVNLCDGNVKTSIEEADRALVAWDERWNPVKPGKE